MCGICGVIQIGGEPRLPVGADVLDAMTDAMAHRGPDDRGTQLAHGAALGARRLSIVDIPGGHQPLANEDGSIWGALNGFVYNHEPLRAELESAGHTFRSVCDTEVIPHAYERWGVGFAERFRGEFGLAVWDARRRRAVVVRDRLGVKPLYWARRDDLVVFATELKSLLASGLIDGQLDLEAIDAYLSLGWFPGPRTPLAGVCKLPPGHRLVVDPDGARLERYWRYPVARPVAIDEREAAERLLGHLDEAVGLRLMSDVPLGAALSGGLDSSMVVALMARRQSAPVKTFAVGFRGLGEANELGEARFVASALGTDHHELELELEATPVSLADLVWHLDEPLADLSALGLVAMSEFAREHVTVALSGMGPDELLGGYAAHRNAALASRWGRLPRPLTAAAEALLGRGPRRARRIGSLLAPLDPTTRYLRQKGMLSDRDRSALLSGPLRAIGGGSARRLIGDAATMLPADPLLAYMGLDAQTGMVDEVLQYVDRAAMARSLDLRAPFLDHELVEFAATLPPSLLVRGRETKRLLRLAARGLVPEHTIARRKVGFFSSSLERWLGAQLDGPITDYLLAERPRYVELDLLDRRTVERIVADHRSGADRSHGQLLLSLLMLEVWLVEYLPRTIGTPAAVTRQLALV